MAVSAWQLIGFFPGRVEWVRGQLEAATSTEGGGALCGLIPPVLKCPKWSCCCPGRPDSTSRPIPSPVPGGLRAWPGSDLVRPTHPQVLSGVTPTAVWEAAVLRISHPGGLIKQGLGVCPFQVRACVVSPPPLLVVLPNSVALLLPYATT